MSGSCEAGSDRSTSTRNTSLGYTFSTRPNSTLTSSTMCDSHGNPQQQAHLHHQPTPICKANLLHQVYTTTTTRT
ncbi:hypothetical protein DPEC_G00081630 [Dallia pectoralis]|uniref:Uncharacterized protein n=1 Tax=Dallia pectoralis TaxID=75939 RepID=A0ACC2GYI9_DALPE|nr:hypothetical protein DPEC_G00081630 [Dallia pectoralis]